MWYNINRTGRLGNRLFSRAHIYAAALELNETVLDWGLLDSKHYFPNVDATKIPIYPLNSEGMHPKLPENILSNKFSLKFLHVIRPRITGKYWIFWNQHWGIGDPEKVRVDSLKFKKFNIKNKNIILNGFKLRCPDLVKKHRNEICNYFQIPKSYSRKWDFLLKNWKKSFSEIIGLHMRAGDFKNAMRGDFYLSPREYAMLIKDKVEINWNDTLIILFSDETFMNNNSWHEVESAFSFTNSIFNNGSILDDLSGLMHCDKIIGPATSTFSRWAAFSGNKDWVGVSRSLLKSSKKLEFKKCPIPWDY